MALLLPGCPSLAPTPAFLRKSARTFLAAKQLIRYMSCSMSMRVFKEFPALKVNIGLPERKILE
jgi:hypothetical protein